VLERHLLAVDLEEEEAERQRLAPLWAVVAPLADRYSKAGIGQRLAALGVY
jgi:hypothetical protein